MSTMKLYGSMIAIVSGAYSIYLSIAAMNLNTPRWTMLVLGCIVIIHGLLLLTPLAARVGIASGIAMIGYSVLMLLNQGWMGTMGMAGRGVTVNMGWDPGMIALAFLMLASGLIMTARREMM